MSEHPDDIPNEYLLKEIEREICDDDRLGELNVHLTVRSGRMYVRGQVTSDQGRRTVLDLVRDRCPQCSVVDELTVAEEALATPPTHSEEIR